MRFSIPALRGVMGGRIYYSVTMALNEIPRLFKFNDWEKVTPEQRAQRVLNKARVPEIAKYMLDNRDSYLFASITACYEPEITFKASSENPDLGVLEIELEDLQLIINDGQHRAAAIATAIKSNPKMGKDKISVLLFPLENLQRMQQMFTDLNRYAHKTSKSLDVLYDHRDSLSSLTMEVADNVEVFKFTIDKERVSIPLRSSKLFTLATLYDANEELFTKKVAEYGTPEYQQQVIFAVEYWSVICDVIDDWKKVRTGESTAQELRQEKVNTHAVMLRALGGIGRIAKELFPNEWKEKLLPLSQIDWRKTVDLKTNPEWDNVCITAGSVVSNRQARVQTLAKLRRVLGLEGSR